MGCNRIIYACSTGYRRQNFNFRIKNMCPVVNLLRTGTRFQI